MTFPVQARNFTKSALRLSRIKLLYDKVTLTRFTILYFFFTLCTCLLSSAFQAIILTDNSQAVKILTDVVTHSRVGPHIAIVVGNQLQACDGIPGEKGANCTVITELTEQAQSTQQRRSLFEVQFRRDDHGPEREHHDDGEFADIPSLPFTLVTPTLIGASPPPPTSTVTSTLPAQSPTSSVSSATTSESLTVSETQATPTQGTASQTVAAPAPSATLVHSTEEGASEVPLELTCVYSLSWLEDRLHDSKREDIAIIFYQLYMLAIGIVTILNESLPHLGAAFLAHILGGAWASSRIQSTKTLTSLYRNVIVPGPCKGVDFLGDWWEEKLVHNIPILVLNAVAVLALGLLSCKLYKVYTSESLNRVGASQSVHTMYKLVLFFSVGLQLGGFFSITSAAMWIDKMTHDNVSSLTQYGSIYLALFSISLVLTLPWLFMGWTSVRKEGRVRFDVFLAVSLALIGISGAIFASALYRTIFKSWQFFATITVTAFAFIVLTLVFGILCRLNFGKGLAKYLHITEELEGANFAQVALPRQGQQFSELVIDEKHRDIEEDLGLPQVPFRSGMHFNRGSSIYSEKGGNPIQLSSTPAFLNSRAPSQIYSPVSVAPGFAGQLAVRNADPDSMSMSSDNTRSRSVINAFPDPAAYPVPIFDLRAMSQMMGSESESGGVSPTAAGVAFPPPVASPPPSRRTTSVVSVPTPRPLGGSTMPSGFSSRPTSNPFSP